jgi:hypothetical protein
MEDTMAKQVLLPAARQVDDVIAKAGAQPVNSPLQIPNGDPKANGAKSEASEPPALLRRVVETH